MCDDADLVKVDEKGYMDHNDIVVGDDEVGMPPSSSRSGSGPGPGSPRSRSRTESPRRRRMKKCPPLVSRKRLASGALVPTHGTSSLASAYSSAGAVIHVPVAEEDLARTFEEAMVADQRVRTQAGIHVGLAGEIAIGDEAGFLNGPGADRG
jgi:hypothetical protein